MRQGKVRVWVMAAAMIAALVMPAYRAVAAQDVDIDKMIETAKTPADHQAIADYYTQQAKAAQAKADEHKQMAKAYSDSTIGRQATKTHFHEHCEALVRIYESEAKEYSALAKAHEDMAKKAAK